MRRRLPKRQVIAPRRVVAPPVRLDPRHAPEPVEILDAVSGPFERHIDAAPRHAHRRR